MNIFEQASRRGLRFTTGQGAVTTEDLWDMPLTHARRGYSLDDLAKDLRRQLKDNEEVSFVTPVTRSDEVLQLKFDIVKHIIEAHRQNINVSSTPGKGSSFTFTIQKSELH